MLKVPAVWAMFLLGFPAQACIALPVEGPETWERQVADAENVFFGTVSNVEVVDKSDPLSDWVVEFEIVHTSKGSPGDSIRLRALQFVGGLCPDLYLWDRAPIAGESLIVFSKDGEVGMPSANAIDLVGDPSLSNFHATLTAPIEVMPEHPGRIDD